MPPFCARAASTSGWCSASAEVGSPTTSRPISYLVLHARFLPTLPTGGRVPTPGDNSPTPQVLVSKHTTFEQGGVSAPTPLGTRGQFQLVVSASTRHGSC